MEEKKKSMFDEFADKGEKVIRNVVDTTSKTVHDGMEWIKENPEKAITIATGTVIAVTGLLRASQSLVVNHRIRMEHRRADMRYYDPHTRMHWDLTRKLSNADKMLILERQAAGQRIDMILLDMGLFKR